MPTISNFAEVEDLNQVALLGLVEAATAFESYARTRMKGAVLEYIGTARYRAHQKVRSIDEFPEFRSTAEELRDPDIAGEERIDQDRQAARVSQAVAELPEPQRKVLQMDDGRGSIPRVMKTMNVSRRTAHRLKASAIENVRLKVVAAAA